MTDLLQVVTTTDTREAAASIARALVEQRLAACVQVHGPVRSTYWWEGAVQESDEWLLVVKTVQAKYGQVEQTIRRLHSYDVPEVLALPVAEASAPYAKWLRDALAREDEAPAEP